MEFLEPPSVVIRRRVRLDQAGQATLSNVNLARTAQRASRHRAQLAEANERTAMLALRAQLNLQPSEAAEPAGDLV